VARGVVLEDAGYGVDGQLRSGLDAIAVTRSRCWDHEWVVEFDIRGLLAEAGVETSVGSVGDSYDNALAETINGLYKAEIIHRRGPWRSFEAVEFATLEWVDWFNHRRRWSRLATCRQPRQRRVITP
jgi:hypothetical protein